MPLASDELDELKRTVFAPRVIGDRVKLIKKGAEYWAKCPFHKDGQERTPSFSVYMEGNGYWMYCCHACGAKGNVFQFVEKFDKISFPEAVQKIKQGEGWSAGKSDVDSTFAPVVPKNSKGPMSFPLSAFAEAEYAFRSNSLCSEFLKRRGIDIETAAALHWGFTQSAKVINPYHEFVDRGWIIFPTIEGETIVNLKYRSLVERDGEKFFLQKEGMSKPPRLYNQNAVNTFDDLFIVEGEIDVATLAMAGFAAVGVPNAKYVMPPDTRDQVMRANTRYLAGDMDEVGKNQMNKLWIELKDSTYRMEWPDGAKDANDFYLKQCGGDVNTFRDRVQELIVKAHEQPIPFVFNLADSIRQVGQRSPMENPNRLRFPWAQIDGWTAVVPGDVMCVFASEPKMGKTTFVQDILLCNAINHGRVVINYSGELSPEAYARRVIASLISKDKSSTFTNEDKESALSKFGDSLFYNGYKPGSDYREVIELLEWAKRRLGGDVFVIDHLHFLTRTAKDEIKAQGEAMRALKDFAVKNNVIMIVVGQPRKAMQQFRNRQVTSQDAKGSEAFGSDASQVFILHRKRESGQSECSTDQPVFSPLTRVTLDYSRESAGHSTMLYLKGEFASFKEVENFTTEEDHGTGQDEENAFA